MRGRIVIADAERLIDETPEGASVEIDVTGVIDAVALEVTTLACTRHPLGFYHFELTPLLDGLPFRLRMHLWSAASSTSRDDLGLIHDHTWDLTSAVLLGELVDVLVIPQATPGGTYRRIEVNYRNGSIEERPGAVEL